MYVEGGNHYYANYRLEKNYTATNTYTLFGNLNQESLTYSFTKTNLANSSDTSAGTKANRVVRTHSYTNNGDQQQITHTPHEGGTFTTGYTLDGSGNRLVVTGSASPTYNPYHNFTKRYNADGQTVLFKRPSKQNGEFLGQYFLHFRYDPFGRQVLSSDTELAQNTTAGKRQYYSLRRKTYSTIHAGHQVEVIRAAEGTYGYLQTCSWFFCITQVNNRQDSWTNSDRIKDQSFSLADGMKNEQWTVMQPFNVLADAALALEAPTPSISATLSPRK